MGTALKHVRTAVDAVAFCCISVVVACAFTEGAAESLMQSASSAVSEYALPLDAEPDA